ncbi:endonuclease V [Streptomyces cocklensis]|jgi:deoxyribonuclease V|uniref:Endonuclease V n=1 Tax=Actinacidiphila cocklensis TaxID=887465 RepID=A0A9W4E1Q3_9ACTN|nr:endonuclease V [Actinacidiphila cocklensis]MDD1057379.1 endonuclease V [Actinacidiphila cocklensis]WSX79088.1 endonuclease V [Streptomyces sp. NBC_00899]CAG6399332.1 Endonuclease V [Actinacidiphila cocklensis]
MDTHSSGGGERAAWPRSADEALAEQERLRALADLTSPGPAPGNVRLVAGVDVSYATQGDALVAAAVVLDAATLETVEVSVVEGTVTFPYVPGLLAFRELPSVITALEKLTCSPDLLVCDGYGIAHPRRAGLAVHLGVLTALPCFGVAKTPFVFGHDNVGEERGAAAPLTSDDGEVVGRALRTQRGVKPVFVSVGHAISLDHACAHTLQLAFRYRLPETTRRADHLSRERLRAITR